MAGPTADYITALVALGPGDLHVLRSHAGRPLDRSLAGFDLFTGLWWPLRQRHANAPRREVAWLVAKLYATVPVPHNDGAGLAARVAQCAVAPRGASRTEGKFDALLTSPLCQIEIHLADALRAVATRGLSVDWVRLTDDLSDWESRRVRERWACDFLTNLQRSSVK